jgi:hypothetical protein
VSNLLHIHSLLKKKIDILNVKTHEIDRRSPEKMASSSAQNTPGSGERNGEK